MIMFGKKNLGLSLGTSGQQVVSPGLEEELWKAEIDY
jgi:hypothetical protein